MIQKFVELGEGYADLYEMFELIKRMPDRLEKFTAIHSMQKDGEVVSLAIVMKPGSFGDFQPIYIALEGLSSSNLNQSKRYQMFEQLAKDSNHTINHLTVKPSHIFHERTLYYQYLIGIFRMNRFIS